MFGGLPCGSVVEKSRRYAPGRCSGRKRHTVLLRSSRLSSQTLRYPVCLMSGSVFHTCGLAMMKPSFRASVRLHLMLSRPTTHQPAASWRRNKAPLALPVGGRAVVLIQSRDIEPVRRPSGRAANQWQAGRVRAIRKNRAGVVELVDTPDLGSGDVSRGGSSPSARTTSSRVSAPWRPDRVSAGRYSLPYL